MKNNSKLVKSADEKDNWQNNLQSKKKLTVRQKLLKLKKGGKINIPKIEESIQNNTNDTNIQNLAVLENKFEITENLNPVLTDKKIINEKLDEDQKNEKEENYHIPVLITKVADFLLPRLQNSNNLSIEQNTNPNSQAVARGTGKIESNKSKLQEKILKTKKTDLKTIEESGKIARTKTKLSIMDGTLGGLGYIDFLNNLVQEGAEFEHLELEFWGSDLDNLVIQRAQRIDNLNSKQSNFADFVTDFEDEFFDGIVLDLGFSSNQLEFGGRGFSHQKLGETLDLRYDIETLESASEKLLKIKDSKYLSNILYSFSGEEFSSRIAVNIYNLVQILNSKKAKKEKIELKVSQIVNCVCEAIPAQFLAKRNQILSRVWQSLRIWTNGEFESLEKFLKVAVKKLKVGGRLIIISFHSLEDKMVANFMRRIERPITDNFGKKTQNWKLLTKKSVKPENSEILQNPRSRSAILRVLKRLN